MEESMEKLLKELLQKKLHGTLTAEEELILSDLAERKRSGGAISTGSTGSTGSPTGLSRADLPGSPMSGPMSGLDKLMNETEALNSSLDDMANKIRNRSGLAQAQNLISEADRKSKDKK